MAAAKKGGVGALLGEIATDHLAHQARELVTAAGEHALSAVGDKAGDLTDRLLDYVENGRARGRFRRRPCRRRGGR